jgi:hypothetical protein
LYLIELCRSWESCSCSWRSNFCSWYSCSCRLTRYSCKLYNNSYNWQNCSSVCTTYIFMYSMYSADLFLYTRTCILARGLKNIGEPVELGRFFCFVFGAYSWLWMGLLAIDNLPFFACNFNTCNGTVHICEKINCRYQCILKSLKYLLL